MESCFLVWQIDSHLKSFCDEQMNKNYYSLVEHEAILLQNNSLTVIVDVTFS